MTKVLHVIGALFDGGTEGTIHTLIQNGFYDDADLTIVENVRGEGYFRSQIVDLVGEDKVVQLNRMTAAKRSILQDIPMFARRLTGAFGALSPNTAILSGRDAMVAGRLAALKYPAIKIINFEHDSRRGRVYAETIMRTTSVRGDAIFGDTAETIASRAKSYRLLIPKHVVPVSVLQPLAARALTRPQVFNLLSLGRLDAQKNYAGLIHAFALLRAKGIDATLTIAGAGNQQQFLTNLIKRLDQDAPHLGLVDRIAMPGFVREAADKQKLFDAAHIYVQPSLFEGFCRTLAEAMAAGLPAVATNFAGVRDYGNRDNVRLIPGIDSDAIARTLERLIQDYDSVAPAMSQAALRTAHQFSLEVVTKQWEAPRREMFTPRHTSHNDVRHYE